MAGRTIDIDVEAYRLLEADKRDNESFSMVIKRRFQHVRTANALAAKLEELALAEDTLDRVDELIRARARSTAQSPVVDFGE